MALTIPLVDLKSQFQEIEKEVYKEWKKVLDTMNLVLGENVSKFEEEFSKYCGVKYAVGVDSGTGALTLGLKALGIGEDDVVITVSHTFFATVEAILNVGAYPKLIDIEEDSYTLDVNQLRKYLASCSYRDKRLIDKSTGKVVKVIIPVHLYGLPANVEEIVEIAKYYDLYVLEDASQAHGAEYKNRKVGSWGDISAFSLYVSKNLGALGEAGILTTNSEKFYTKLQLLRSHGQINKYTHKLIGFNARLDELQAVVLKAKLKRLDKWNNRRIHWAIYYMQKLKSLPIKLPQTLGRKHVFHLFVIRVRERDNLLKFLNKNGIGASIHYPVPVHLQPAVEFLGYKKDDLPVTEKVVQEIISLPIYPHLDADKIDYIVDQIFEFFDKGGN